MPLNKVSNIQHTSRLDSGNEVNDVCAWIKGKEKKRKTERKAKNGDKKNKGNKIENK